MSTANMTIPKTGLTVTGEMSGVQNGYYHSMFEFLDQVSRRDSDSSPEYREIKFIISNYIYLVYERLQLNLIREIDYEQVRSWAHTNKKLAKYLLKRYSVTFPMEAFEKWITPDVDMLNCAMYRPSNRFTKHRYH